MGCDASNFLPRMTSPEKIGKVLLALGYTRLRKGDEDRNVHAYYNFWADADYRSLAPIWATVSKPKGAFVEVHTKTTIWRSPADTEKHNETLRELRQHFG